MSFEIERKFLVTGDSWRHAIIDSDLIRDGVVSEHNGAKVRVRLGQRAAWLTVKTDRAGPSRLEYEYEIPRADAEDMLVHICDDKIFEKTRYQVLHGGNTWQVDVYDGRLSGIVLAEIELQSENQAFEIPEWVGQEVTYHPHFHKRHIGRLCHDAGRPLTVAELLDERAEGGVASDAARLAG
ncbi:CYTH domain-containing protein [Rhodoblastus sp.]|uniref:CYTH domain-containing protein n=1 Tax=Rhodoblastus sp. TaxID=1962975 RepID=UPI0035B2942C